MFNLIKRFKRKTPNPIDSLLKMCENKVYLWNGVNLNREMMFRHGFPLGSTVSSGDFYDISRGDYPGFVSVAFGSICLGPGDWCCGDTASEPAVRLYITNKNEIVCCEVSDNCTKRTKDKLEKIQAAILSNRNTVVNECKNDLFRTMLCVIHNTLPPAALYSRCIMHNGVLDYSYISYIANELATTWHTYNTRRYE